MDGASIHMTLRRTRRRTPERGEDDNQDVGKSSVCSAYLKRGRIDFILNRKSLALRIHALRQAE